MLTVLVSIASLCWVKGAALLACAPFGSGCLLLGMLVLSGVDVLAALVAAALALSRRVRPTWGSAVAALLMAVALIALWNVDAHGSGAVVACGAVLALTIVAPLQFCILLLGRGGRTPGRRRAPLAAAVLCGSAASVALLTMGAADAHRLLPDLLDALWREMGFGTLVIDQMPVSVSLADVVRLSTGTDTTAPAAAPVGLALLVAIPLAVCLLRVGPWRARRLACLGLFTGCQASICISSAAYGVTRGRLDALGVGLMAVNLIVFACCAIRQMVARQAGGATRTGDTAASDASRAGDTCEDDPHIAAQVESWRERGLSERECETLRHRMAGDTSAETARALGISASTVRTYQERALAKLGMGSIDEIRNQASDGRGAFGGRASRERTNGSADRGRCATARRSTVLLLVIPAAVIALWPLLVFLSSGTQVDVVPFDLIAMFSLVILVMVLAVLHAFILLSEGEGAGPSEKNATWLRIVIAGYVALVFVAFLCASGNAWGIVMDTVTCALSVACAATLASMIWQEDRMAMRRLFVAMRRMGAVGRVAYLLVGACGFRSLWRLIVTWDTSRTDPFALGTMLSMLSCILFVGVLVVMARHTARGESLEEALCVLIGGLAGLMTSVALVGTQSWGSGIALLLQAAPQASAHGVAAGVIDALAAGAMAASAAVIMRVRGRAARLDELPMRDAQLKGRMKGVLMGCGFTPLYADVAVGIASGLSRREICQELNCAPGTVNDARHQAFRYFDVHTSRDLKVALVDAAFRLREQSI
ncbi:LuxR C-terminal-related transcriptional regulator [Collinsella sp. An271]|uniref:LuxR C-terminal-related transcriptional regulator n=1 Tax=Collinsella sp. An271 TaxID=1965616 RepID=UPI001EF52F86|nr:LuxR C-terminal-related transcriptional regulator [Collinsella sp. An271]